MRILMKFVAVLLGAAVVWSPVADAASATATANVNVRSGPGTGYSRLSLLPVGATVEVRNCEGAWCRIAHGDVDGFVSSRYLMRDGYPGVPRQQSGTNIAPPMDVPTTSPTYDPDRFRSRSPVQDYSDFRDFRRNRGYEGWTIPHLDITSRRTSPRRW